ncbi:GNAT family N-acetyltransferase [Mucilaginibacter phyllosphaerae]|uniref:N-acetyltransferase n=1 Tax=Mucilaginibacter phyllosphaerae TaxID=1812349 RepID=A0A4Y8A7V4_9SPHI|nr:GNAT family protein [Mucilaginibacter phyllosphaerae]MBB3971069.1 RimJ/RimL family protein N-acetyltransferase [Mucilaginibacter phyllosphaerae]TEW63807.1 N-acetyltransferase [Mucilaginibacter phyllosphaerae]GGH22287.1 N-acetyltransferase [Mucilaginibacter phyllosphaerae]
MEIKGSQFTLRHWQQADAPALQKHANNPKVPAYLQDRFPTPYTLKDAEAFIGLMLNRLTVTNFAIIINGEAAGGIGLQLRDDVHRKSPLIGYWLGEQYWGRGIATEAVRLVTAYTFTNFDIICIQAAIFSKNPASMRVLEKAGYTLQGVLKQSVIKNGEVMDEHVYIAYPTNCPIYGLSL